MTDSTQLKSFLPWIAMVVGISITIVVAIAILKSVPTGELEEGNTTWLNSQLPNAQSAGIQAVLTSGDVTIKRNLLRPDFTLKENQQLDALLPPGPAKSIITVTFSSRDVRRAAIGAEIQGGSLVITRDGKNLLSDYAGSESRVVLTPVQYLPTRPLTFTFEFSRDSSAPARFRALWLPEGSVVPLPLPTSTDAILNSETVRGFSLVQKYNCAACHESENAQLQASLQVSPAPILGSIGSRAKPAWIRKWITNPQEVKAHATMPKLFHGNDLDEQEIEDLTHFLVSMGGPIDDAQADLDIDMVNTGMVSYHTFGCFACHGPLEPLGNLPGENQNLVNMKPAKIYTELGPLDSKTTVDQLAAFLKDPVSIRPSGRMPSLNLSELESKSIASYLIANDRKSSDSANNQVFVIDSERVSRGHDIFADRGCASCHSLGPNRSAIASTTKVSSLKDVIDSLLASPTPDGCLSDIPRDNIPEFDLSSFQKQDIIIYLLTVPDQLSVVSPHDELASAMERFNCLACHTFQGIGGPEPATSQYFRVQGEADLGDEGRLPPDIGDVGARLHPDWLRMVLEDAAVARPYMGARMPQFGKVNVESFPDLFMSASGVGHPADDPVVNIEDSSIGRKLAGSGGFSCIQCHSIAGKDAADFPGPDLAFMPERLRYDYFVQWLMDPKRIRSNTRMPTFFFEGFSGNNEYYNGNAQKQIDALWGYLSQGEFLPMPDGMIDPGSYMLEVVDEPVVLRTFMADVGSRTIAVGFPEQLHCAFDAEKCKLAVAWEGQFLSAQAIWGGRGGSETNPGQGLAWQAPKGPVFIIGDVLPSPWPEDYELNAQRFRGYSFDENKYPTFNYEIKRDGVVVSIEEKPRAVIEAGRSYLLREFVLRGPEGAKIFINLSGNSVTADLIYLNKLDDAGHYQVTLDANGSAIFSVEINW